jgi:hypothetical protein
MRLASDAASLEPTLTLAGADESEGQALTLTQAAAASGLSRTSLRRFLNAKRFPNAFKDAEGRWRLTESDLRSAGIVVDPLRALSEPAPHELVAEIDRLRTENALLRELLVATQAVAREREERIHDLRFALRMLPEAWAEKLERTESERILGTGRAEVAQAASPAPSEPARALRSAPPASPATFLPETAAPAEPPAETDASTGPGTTREWHGFAEALWSGGATGEPDPPKSDASDLARTWRALGEERNRLRAELSGRGGWWRRLLRRTPEPTPGASSGEGSEP